MTINMYLTWYILDIGVSLPQVQGGGSFDAYTDLDIYFHIIYTIYLFIVGTVNTYIGKYVCIVNGFVV